jgi:hypothetical protein
MTDKTMTEPTAIYVPKRHLMELLCTLVDDLSWTTDVAAVIRLRPAFATIAAHYRGLSHADTDKWRIDPVDAYCLQHYADALTVYDLDECDDESYNHPAVRAELDVLYQLMDETPLLEERLSAQYGGNLDAMTVTFHAEGSPA